MSVLLLIVFSMTLLVVSSAMATEVYRWVDEYGNVHFGETPPSGIAKEQTTIKVDTPEKSGNKIATDKQIENLHQGYKEIEKKEQQREREAAQAQQKKRNYCDKKREELARIQAYLVNIDNTRDRRKEQSLIELLSRECKGNYSAVR